MRNFLRSSGLVEQELDETLLWIELLVESEIVKLDRLQPLHEEAEELLKIMVASIKRIKAKGKR